MPNQNPNVMNQQMQQQQQQQQGTQLSESMPPNKSHGGHELFDTHEVIGGVIGTLDQYELYNQHIQDQQLKSILNRQKSFLTELYNIMVETLKTGQKPSQSTSVYHMTESNDVMYGLTPSTPKKPVGSVNELKDENISGFMLGQVKGLASMMAMTALEMTNPVMRRVTADSVPNLIEMSYEVFLYQNRNGYYQVAQLADQDMTHMVDSYAPAPPPTLN
ncbi:spore coat protein [Salipaludibacillus sp. CUR1]|uniref:spore coat protein n=1 Tax=Salipaludibacillus sp. CUR1 TaxID=2820003 RepID=UPI001E4E7E23|nr:spore coat protein [Salipaludibacillus sp. CUR1]MCE7792777.1 spore coat protein [Salipaludibacillus sp. CUR1]